MPFFHLYGLIIGLSFAAAGLLIEHQAKRHQSNTTDIWSAGWWVLVGGVLGARTYHVITDAQFYQSSWLDIFKIWQGGLGIMGGVAGGVAGLFVYFKIAKQDRNSFKQWLDLAVFGLPFAQAIGRLGNFVNQELFGLPTNLPWGIFIDYSFRPVGYQQFTKFHPLFAYEALLMILFGVMVWFFDRSQKIAVGTGRLFLVYVSYYSLIRFWLQFLRVDRKVIWWILDINQIVVLVLLLVCLIQGIFFFVKSNPPGMRQLIKHE